MKIYLPIRLQNSGYSQGTAGAINGERTAAAAALSAVKNKIENLNGDPAFFNFFDRNSSRLVLRQYNYTSTSEPNQIIDPQAATWSSLVTPIVWSGVANLHGVATSGKWLFGTGYDLSKIAVVDMDTNYEQTQVEFLAEGGNQRHNFPGTSRSGCSVCFQTGTVESFPYRSAG